MKEAGKKDKLLKEIMQDQLQTLSNPDFEKNIIQEIEKWEAKKDRRRSLIFLCVAIILALVLLLIVNPLLHNQQISLVIMKTHLDVFLSILISGITIFSLILFLNNNKKEAFSLKSNY